MRLLKYITFLENEVLELWKRTCENLISSVCSDTSPFWRQADVFLCSEDHLGFVNCPATTFYGTLYKDSVIAHVKEGFGCLDMPIRSRSAGCCTGTTGCVGEHAAPELLPFPSTWCINTATSNQVANSILMCKVKSVLILRPGSYFKITTALNSW